MKGFCATCAFWAENVAPKRDDWGWCQAMAVIARPEIVEGDARQSKEGAGVETHAASACSHYVPSAKRGKRK